jgi:hypothetical protein
VGFDGAQLLMSCFGANTNANAPKSTGSNVSLLSEALRHAGQQFSRAVSDRCLVLALCLHAHGHPCPCNMFIPLQKRFSLAGLLKMSNDAASGKQSLVSPRLLLVKITLTHILCTALEQ